MRIQDGDMSSGSARTRIDRHAVVAAGQLLISAIWLEHRVRRFSTRLGMLPSQRASVESVEHVGSSSKRTEGCSFLTARAIEPTLTKRRARPNDYVHEGRLQIQTGGRF